MVIVIAYDSILLHIANLHKRVPLPRKALGVVKLTYGDWHIATVLHLLFLISSTVTGLFDCKNVKMKILNMFRILYRNKHLQNPLFYPIRYYPKSLHKTKVGSFEACACGKEGVILTSGKKSKYIFISCLEFKVE